MNSQIIHFVKKIITLALRDGNPVFIFHFNFPSIFFVDPYNMSEVDEMGFMNSIEPEHAK